MEMDSWTTELHCPHLVGHGGYPVVGAGLPDARPRGPRGRGHAQPVAGRGAGAAHQRVGLQWSINYQLSIIRCSNSNQFNLKLQCVPGKTARISIIN